MALSLFISCASDSPSGPGNNSPFEIQGTVIDTDGNLLSDVNLYLIFNFNNIINKDKIRTSNVDSVSYFNQNFPNPFVDATNITFNINAPGLVTLYLTPFNSNDTIKTVISTNLTEGFYALFVNEELVNGLYSLKMHVQFPEDSLFQDEKLILRNNNDPDSIITETNTNLEIFNSSFKINYGSIPFGKEISITESSPIVLETKIISNELTFVLTKSGYKNLVETHTINSSDNTKIIFRMERE
ncbi:MAG: hypothetical protein KJN64_08595 [Ignavibacteria bacterium]|nr:hypothetical protein [Ignavibacteria bacterium]MBT8383969.1 hypothetical protein [Ignavibacteria bacterium]MBT8391497.1 hypothetical protein [Ignavibacteria bacterium]NNL20612.1 hypothetical protein [Ignavibacteriaceae bacterium]